MFEKASVLEQTEGNKDLPFIAKMKDFPGKPSVLWYKKSKQKENRTEGNKGTLLVPPKAFDSQCKYINCRMIHKLQTHPCNENRVFPV